MLICTCVLLCFESLRTGFELVLVSKQKQTLFIKNLPTETTPEQVKALSADIIEVRMDVSQNKSEKNPKFVLCFVIIVLTVD